MTNVLHTEGTVRFALRPARGAELSRRRGYLLSMEGLSGHGHNAV
jgi:hypothetical protein